MTLSMGKYTKYQLMNKESELFPYLPKTKPFTYKNFFDLLDRYKIVIVKPCIGSSGRGIIQVKNIDESQYEIQEEDEKFVLEGKRNVYHTIKETIKKNKRSKFYIVQEKISLARIKNSPFDLRVIVQRKKNSNDWKVTGKLVKVAEKGYFVTNVAKLVLPFAEMLEHSSIEGVELKKLEKEIDQVTLRIANLLQNYYLTREIGLDIGITDTGKIYIIEANLWPNISMFNHLKDKTMYQQIKIYRNS